MENSIYAKIITILQKVEIPNCGKFMTNMYAGTKGDIFRRSLKDTNIVDMQTGGAEKYKIINYHGVDFKFLIYDTAGILTYALHILNDSDKLPECIAILIHKNENTAQIHEISQQLSCYSKEQRETLIKSKIKISGELLMKLAIHLIIKIKDEYDIKYIVLQDNSHKMCDTSNIRLGLMYTLLNGKTWYSKFEFVPANDDGNDIDEGALKSMKKNQKIMDAITVKDAANILTKLILKYDPKIKAALCSEMIKANENLKLSDFLRKISLRSKTKKGCCYAVIFESIYRELAKKIGIVDFFAQMFILKFIRS
jgi:hypothetical protein